jgi:FkbM family methyltransferase
VLSELVTRLSQSAAVQLAVKRLQLPRLGSAVLSALGSEASVAGTGVRYRVRFIDTLVLAQSIFGGGEYEPLEAEAASIRRFVDLGCNVGLFPLFLCAKRGAFDVEGILVDGNPEVAAEARRNMALNALETRTDVLHGLAGGPTSGDAVFTVAQNTLSSTRDASMLGSTFGTRTVRVPWVNVPAAVDARFGAEARLDVLKIDIEGAELEFLQANPGLLARSDRVILEFHKPKVTLEMVQQLLEPTGLALRWNHDAAGAPHGVAYFKR